MKKVELIFNEEETCLFDYLEEIGVPQTTAIKVVLNRSIKQSHAENVCTVETIEKVYSL